jgi:hypothetical protein
MDLREGHFLDSTMAFLTRNGRERRKNALAGGTDFETIPVARSAVDIASKNWKTTAARARIQNTIQDQRVDVLA